MVIDQERGLSSNLNDEGMVQPSGFGDKRMTSQGAVRRRSYLIWEREGCPDGKAIDHWVRARAELEAESHGAPLALAFSLHSVAPRPPISVLPQRIVAGRITMRDGSAVNAARK